MHALPRTLLAGAALTALLSCTTSFESSMAYTGDPGDVSLPVYGFTVESTGWVQAQVLTSLDTSARDPAATWSTLAALPIDGAGVSDGTMTIYPWGGILSGFTPSTWPDGGVARVRILHPANGAYVVGNTFDDLGCLDDNSNLDFQARADACESHDNGYFHLVDGDPISPSSVDYISARATPVVRFNGVIISNPADNYYARIDPLGAKATLSAWKSANGFDAAGDALPGYEAATSALYYNNGDLELGRDMHCVKRSNSPDLACYVTNYGDADAIDGPHPGDDSTVALLATVARDPDGVVATVAMEYRSSALTDRVTFYAFGPDGARVAEAELDSENAKGVPGACLSCHGGHFDGTTFEVTGAHFLPFDVDNFIYSSATGHGLSAQQARFRKLNRMVLATGPTAAISQLVNGWYGNNLSGTGPNQDTSYVPPGWEGQEVVYRKVVKPYCRGCHIALNDPASPPTFVDFDTYDDLVSTTSTIQRRVCDDHDMPHAEVTRRRFWTSPARGHLIGALQLSTACD